MNIEPLEARIAPASLHVTSLLDDMSGGTLREAILAANLDSTKADTIVFDAIAGTGTILLTAPIGITGPLTIKGPGIDKISVSGGDGVRQFYIDDNDPATLSPVAISGISLVHGGAGTNGGAIFSAEPLTLANVVFSSNSCNNLGGALYVETAGKVSITGCKFLNNEIDQPTGNGAGAMSIGAAGGILLSKTLVAGNKVLAGDTAAGASLVSSGPKGSVTVSDCTFVNNTGADIAGALFVAVDAGRPGTIKNSVFADHLVTGEGGAVQLANGKFGVTGCSFTHNSAVTGGGAIDIVAGVTATISKSVFSDNSAVVSGSTPRGGAIRSSATLLTITGSEFTGNTSEEDGGAIALEAGTLVVSGVRFDGNHADVEGGALWLTDAGATIGSSIFSGNSCDGNAGAIFQRNGSLALKTDSFIGNHSGASGGALLADGEVIVTGGKFLHNTADSNGAAIFTKHSDPNSAGSLVVTGALFQGNLSDFTGGALFFFDDSTGTIKGPKFLANSTKSTGGAISSLSTGTIDLSGSFFRGNAAADGGGAVRILTGDARIDSCSFYDNTGSEPGSDGGAISIAASAGVVTLSKLKVIGNSASIGGGISNAGGATTLTASTVTENFAPTDPNTSGI